MKTVGDRTHHLITVLGFDLLHFGLLAGNEFLEAVLKRMAVHRVETANGSGSHRQTNR